MAARKGKSLNVNGHFRGNIVYITILDYSSSFSCTWIAFGTFCMRAAMKNTIRYEPEVETVSQTGSSNNLATETDIDAISMAIPMLWWANFSLVYMPTSPDASFTLNFNMADGYRK